jgi:SNF family Na+-dependent transporter
LGLLVLAVLLAGFVYATRQSTPLTTLLNDRPIAILVLLLVAAFMVIRMFGTVFAFLFGIALPLAGKSSEINLLVLNYWVMKFRYSWSCNSAYAKITK